MKIVAILLLTTSVIAAGMPFALAASCATPPHEELQAVQSALPEGTYLYDSTADGADATKTGVWTEANGLPGLQTSTCRIGGLPVYVKDTKALV